jgi:hypothetical protein
VGLRHAGLPAPPAAHHAHPRRTTQVKAQAAALAAERESLAAQRLRAEDLAGLAEQVGWALPCSIEYTGRNVRM